MGATYFTNLVYWCTKAMPLLYLKLYLRCKMMIMQHFSHYMSNYYIMSCYYIMSGINKALNVISYYILHKALITLCIRDFITLWANSYIMNFYYIKMITSWAVITLLAIITLLVATRPQVTSTLKSTTWQLKPVQTYLESGCYVSKKSDSHYFFRFDPLMISGSHIFFLLRELIFVGVCTNLENSQWISPALQ